MSLRQGHGLPDSGEEIQGYYQTLGPEWPGVDTPAFQTPYMDVNQPYCSEPIVHPNILTPISLPDSSFHPSPVAGHRAPEYHPQEYRYVNDPIVQTQGLGICAPFPSEYPRSSAPSSASYAYAPDHLHYGLGQTPAPSPRAPPPKRMKRTPSKTPSRDTPINILPHPEGMERMERDRERRSNQPSPPIMPPKPRAPGRGRRDPQAEEEDLFVESLREQGYSWKVTRDLFCEHFEKDVTEARLQMRLGRRKKERSSRWEDADIQLLTSAHESWRQEKYRFIANKMKELGSTKIYTPEQCKLQLALLETKQDTAEEEQGSPSMTSEPPNSPPAPSTSRKRRRNSLE
ncbi:hypothetical protein N7533_007455 [Penicillium manginii]|uniref:uncharacterized protein n=1 Tax=Penicillium manginii TaxID=203109 RepID=UPI0025478B86|nr:uncharacterized protein N7533_007455 [Penicillium manginii]KAJ5750427.1 hypothetical protein N7533_007455 [Penicillium manginii]